MKDLFDMMESDGKVSETLNTQSESPSNTDDKTEAEKPKKQRKKKEPFVLTIDVFQDNLFQLENKINLFSMKQVYVGKRLKGDPLRFYQLLGNLNSVLDLTINETLEVCIVSDNSYYDLRNGVKDETMLTIEKFVDSKKSKKLLFKFVTESDFLRYYNDRMKVIDDDVVSSCFHKYINS